MTLPHHLDRTISIRAPRETVFHFFTDSARWAAWWGQGSTIDPRPGGRVHIRYPDGTEAGGEVIELTAPDRLTFSFGFASGKPFAAGASRVTLKLEPEGTGTRLHLSHAFPDAVSRDEFVQGWRFQLSLFANAIANELHAGAAQLVDNWFAAWAEPDAAAREQAFIRISSDAVRFADRFSCIEGRADLLPHVTAAQRFMPGLRMERRGDLRHCQGTALANWAAVTADGQERGAGTNVFVFGADGRIESVTGFWSM